MSFRRGRRPPFSASACLADASRRERPLVFKPSRKLSRRRASLSIILCSAASSYLAPVALPQGPAGLVASPHAWRFSRPLCRESLYIFSVPLTLASAPGLFVSSPGRPLPQNTPATSQVLAVEQLCARQPLPW